MKVGVFGVLAHNHVPPRVIATELERRGFDLFCNGEHYHLPTATPTPAFYKEIPDFYKYVPDPLQVFAHMAAVTKRLRFCSSILVVPIHDALMLATRIGTLDYLTEGRTMIGMGVGWNQEELANHGTDFATRQERLRETVLAMKLAWQDAPAAYNGQFVKFTESWSGPKPVQKPHPPLLLGGRPLKKNFASIAEFCDGWLPTDTYAKTFGADLPAELERLRNVVREAGRDPASLHNTFMVSELGLYDRDPTQYAADCLTRDQLAGYEELGFAEIAVGVPTFSHDHFMAALDHLQRVAEPWLSH